MYLYSDTILAERTQILLSKQRPGLRVRLGEGNGSEAKFDVCETTPIIGNLANDFSQHGGGKAIPCAISMRF